MNFPFQICSIPLWYLLTNCMHIPILFYLSDMLLTMFYVFVGPSFLTKGKSIWIEVQLSQNMFLLATISLVSCLWVPHCLWNPNFEKMPLVNYRLTKPSHLGYLCKSFKNIDMTCSMFRSKLETWKNKPKKNLHDQFKKNLHY